jgi:sentrin-specific protease 7
MLVESMMNASRGSKISTANQQGFDAQGQEPSGRLNFDSTTPHTQSTSIYIPDDEPISTGISARKIILQSSRQGVVDNLGATTSPRYPKARINESTAEVGDRIGNGNRRQARRISDDLRTFQRANEAELSSGDELASDLYKTSEARPRISGSVSKKVQPANSGARRKARVEKSPQGWPLVFARSNDFDSQNTSRYTTMDNFLYLRRDTAAANTWQIIAHNASSGVFETKAEITPKAVVRAAADNEGRIRLEGPRGQDGNQPTFDLEFQNTEAFHQFRDVHAMELLGRSRLKIVDQHHMATLFSKPIRNNDKVGKTSPIYNLEAVAEDEESTRTRATKSPIWTQMKIDTRTRRPDASVHGQDESLAAAQMQPSARPTRSTRASAPTHDISDDEQGNEVEKYSVVSGLGPKWVKPLTYGEGRQKATVYYDDLWRLDEEEFMNDSLIDFYMIYLFKQSKIPQDNVYFFNTFFFSKLIKNPSRGEYINYEAVKRWTSKIDLFKYDYIVVPINADTHWYLAVICNVGKIPRKAIEEDFDKSVGSEVVDDESTLGELVGTQVPIEHPLAAAPDGSSPSIHAAAENIETDVNLFDEDSKLDLINREDIGDTTEGHEAVMNGSSVPQSPQANVADVEESIFDQPVAPKTVLSNLNASPEKKKPRRRFVAARKDPNQPVIIILDSLGQTRSPTVRALKAWLAAEGESKRGMEALIKEKGFYPKSDQIPTQSNFTDCGVYLLGYAEKFFQNPDEFKRKLLTGEMTAAEDWPQLKPREMRSNLREIIFTLAKEQRLTEDVKKKSKKGAVVGKTSPSQPNGSISNPCSVSKEPELADPQEKDAMVPLDEQAGKPTIPRLGSPFSPKMKVESRAPAAEPSTTSGEVPNSIALPCKASTASPRSPQTLGKWTHPEVRIVKQKPSAEPTNRSPSTMTSPARGIKSPPQDGLGTRSVSPMKRSRPPADTDERERPVKRKATPEVVLVKQKNVLHANPLSTHSQEGHSNHPIEIMDSQESKPTATQSPRSNRLGPAAQGKRLSMSPSKTKTLVRATSFEEIPGFPSHVVQKKHDQSNKESTDGQPEAELDADDAQRKSMGRREWQTTAETLELEERGESSAMELDSQRTDPMDTADDVVCETPEPSRMSPPLEEGWVSGQPLPH